LRTDPAVNKDVRLAALSRDLNHAALVVTNPQSGQTQLLLGDGTGPGNPTYVAAKLSGKVWTRPAFLPSATARVLVAVDGILYLVKLDGSATQLSVKPMQVDQFAMAPDGRRIGVISGKVAYVYSLAVTSDDEIAFNSESERLINVGFAECSAIAWSLPERVLIAGTTLDGKHRLAESTVDGAIVTLWSSDFSAQIQSLVTLTPSVWTPSPALEVAVIQAGAAYRVGPSSGPDTVGFVTTGTPSPSASGAPQGPNLGTPTFPFYLG
jgi:hypothetical protein